MATVRRVLIANRGEIAARIVRTCRILGIETVLAVSDADRDSLPARLADAVIRVGPARSADSYLNVAAVVGAAVAADADAVHPGYGFLSESAELATACEAAGVIFIGATAAQLAAVGDKVSARRHALAAGLPVLPGGEVAGQQQATNLAATIGWPVLIKAVSGGGGRGLRPVHDPARLAEAVALAMAEADAAFGDQRIYLERYVTAGRHVEVQLLGDGERVIHLGDRDCSMQRRYQKLIEEAPAPLLADELREQLRHAAVAFGEHLRYRGLGTVEFLVDCERDTFYFLEMNARIQVEHPVTEAISGLDLVAEQIWVAEGKALRMEQDGVALSGHAIECRINAEDWTDGFRPSPGTVTAAAFPVGPGIRVDTAIQPGSQVPAWYDSLLAKVIVRGRDRAEALAGMRDAMARCRIAGVATTISMHAALLATDDFASGGTDTSYLDHFLLDRGVERRAAGGRCASGVRLG
jgi:acetyl-CoA carboxylase biotin carboxylase subunit